MARRQYQPRRIHRFAAHERRLAHGLDAAVAHADVTHEVEPRFRIRHRPLAMTRSKGPVAGGTGSPRPRRGRQSERRAE
jgi:hypothetical protein